MNMKIGRSQISWLVVVVVEALVWTPSVWTAGTDKMGMAKVI